MGICVLGNEERHCVGGLEGRWPAGLEQNTHTAVTVTLRASRSAHLNVNSRRATFYITGACMQQYVALCVLTCDGYYLSPVIIYPASSLGEEFKMVYLG